MKNKWLIGILVFIALPLFAAGIELKYDDEGYFSSGYVDKPN